MNLEKFTRSVFGFINPEDFPWINIGISSITCQNLHQYQTCSVDMTITIKHLVFKVAKSDLEPIYRSRIA